jgi:uncharacterized protein YkwD
MQKKKPLKHAVRRTYKKPKKQTHPVVHGLKFLPAILLFASAIVLYRSTAPKHSNTEHNSVLSYATSVSGGDLLAQTNAQRANNGVASLDLNGQLTSAAQTKANDMVARNYWSHTTPDGDEPWVFITNAGYDYQTAGENLAYGFASSAETVTGWMNSPPHRQNLLNSAFSEVGFGFANSPNFISDGQQTVVVAMYGSPIAQQAAPAAPAPTAPSSTPPAQSSSGQPNSSQAANTPSETTQTPATTSPAPAASSGQSESTTSTTSTSTKPQLPVVSSSVRRIQLLTGGNARWSGTLLVASMCGVGVFWALERRRQLKHFAIASEHFILKHLHVDLAVAGFIALGFALLQTSGLVR